MNKLNFRRGFKTEANRIAVRVREALGLADIDPIVPEEVCHHYDIELMKLSESECDASAFLGEDQEHFSAVIVPRGARIAIVYNDSHHPYRQRSNICHELGHCFLGHKSTPPLTPEGERIHDGSIEGEANFLAGALLLTNEGAIHILRRGLLPVAQNRYGISQKMLDYRLNISGAYKRHQRRL